NLGISHRIDSSNNLYFSGYFSNDRFALDSDTTYGYSNRNFSVKWTHKFSNRLNLAFTTGYDGYRYKVFREEDKETAFKLQFGIRQFHGKADFVYYLSQQHGFDFGLSSIHYRLQPGSYTPFDNNSVILPDVVEDEQALESGAYLTHRFNPTNRLAISTGIRFSMFDYLGPQSINYYAEGLPKTEVNLLETKNHKKESL
ncbi:MAG TPA: TonB-dependent receptor, partial [Chitinophagaceae bacterium]|nr:TonB-dependent receptor [Chitinophagaceae bacterium]